MTQRRRETFDATVPSNFAPLLILGVAEQPWITDALCAQVDAEAFFPEKGQSTRLAKATCRRCPVSAECLDYALDHQEAFGVWGGLSERERRALLRPNQTHPCKGCGQPIHVQRTWCDPCHHAGIPHQTRTNTQEVA